MSHQCVSCGTIYEDNAPELLSGCKCGRKLFFFLKNGNGKKIAKLTKAKREQIEEEAKEILNENEENEISELDCVKVLGKGKYSISLDEVFHKVPVVYKLDNGRFIIDVEEGLKQAKK